MPENLFDDSLKHQFLKSEGLIPAILGLCGKLHKIQFVLSGSLLYLLVH